MFAFCVWRRPFLAVAGLCLLFCTPIEAGEASDEAGFARWLALPEGRIETSQGFDVTATSWGAYAAANIAPMGPLHEDGLRLKLYGGYGVWSYTSRRVYCALSREEMKALTGGVAFAADCNALVNVQLPPEEVDAIRRRTEPFGLTLEGDQLYWGGTHRVARYDFAAMPGYQVSWQNLAVKAYLGPAMEMRTVLPEDAAEPPSGSLWGARSVLESWLALTSALWITADGSYFTASKAYSAAIRLGWEPLSWLTLGPEAAAYGDAADESTRLGGFLRFDIGKTETTLSGGISTDDAGVTSAYGSAGVYMRF